MTFYYFQLYGCVPQGHCLKIISDDVDEQLKEFIDYYKVNVTKDDVFSVCQVVIVLTLRYVKFDIICTSQACNGRNFIQVSHSTMLALKDSHDSRKYAPPDEDNDLEYLDEATGFSSDEEYDAEPGAPIQSTRKWDLCNVSSI